MTDLRGWYVYAKTKKETQIMAITIHNNQASLVAQNHASRTKRGMQSNMARLASGLRVNNAADDAAGMAVSEDINLGMRTMSQAKRNAADAISALQTAEGSLGQRRTS